jgi:actin-like ATPase involved in cell morphogenesis
MVTTVRKFGEELNRFLTMSLAEIQEAIEKLAPEERAALREWLDEFDPDAMAVVRERVRQIRAGEATLIDGDQVQEEMRQLARQIANQ